MPTTSSVVPSDALVGGHGRGVSGGFTAGDGTRTSRGPDRDGSGQYRAAMDSRRPTRSASLSTSPPTATGSPSPPTWRPPTFHGSVAIELTVHAPTDTSSCATPPSSSSADAWVELDGRRHRRCTDHARRRRRTGPLRPRSRRFEPGAIVAARRLRRRPQRQAPRLLPVDVHRRRRWPPHHRRHAVRGHRRPPGVPLLGRARATRRSSP